MDSLASHWGKGKREGAVEFRRGVEDGVQRPSPGSNCSSSGPARGGVTGWGLVLRSVPTPALLKKPEPHKARPGVGGAGPV